MTGREALEGVAKELEMQSAELTALKADVARARPTGDAPPCTLPADAPQPWYVTGSYTSVRAVMEADYGARVDTRGVFGLAAGSVRYIRSGDGLHGQRNGTLFYLAHIDPETRSVAASRGIAMHRLPTRHD